MRPEDETRVGSNLASRWMVVERLLVKIPVVEEAIDLFRPGNLRATLILVTSVLMIVTLKTAGSQSFYKLHLADQFPATDPVVGAAWYQMTMTFVLLGLVPALLVRLVLRESLSSVGLGLGSVLAGLVLVALATPFIFWISSANATHADFREIYPLNRHACACSEGFAAHVASLGLFYLGWEFHFRGFLQKGLGNSFGPTVGLWVQVLVSSVLHFDRPDSELWASVPAAALWGLQSRYTGAIWAGVIEHWLLGATLDYFICFA